MAKATGSKGMGPKGASHKKTSLKGDLTSKGVGKPGGPGGIGGKRMKGK